jgi:hypothetical protein
VGIFFAEIMEFVPASDFVHDDTSADGEDGRSFGQVPCDFGQEVTQMRKSQ